MRSRSLDLLLREWMLYELSSAVESAALRFDGSVRNARPSAADVRIPEKSLPLTNPQESDRSLLAAEGGF
jgi:hypothetical protein